MLIKFVLLVVLFFGVCGFARILLMRFNATTQQLAALRQQMAQNDAKLYAQMEQLRAAQAAAGEPADSHTEHKGT